MSIVFIYLRFAVVEACSNSWASLITMAILLAVGNAGIPTLFDLTYCLKLNL